MTTTQYLDRPGGRIAYSDSGGDGPLVIAAPGMGDTREVYRHVRAPLLGAGIRLVTMDLRGMGESSPRWDDLSEEAVASDFLALIDEVGGEPAVLVGNSLSCASAVIAAVDHPGKVAAVALLGPFVRPVPTKWWQKVAFALMLAPPWGRSAWVSYYRKNLYPELRPDDLDEYAKGLSGNLAQTGRMGSFRGLAANSHDGSGERLPELGVPAVVIMGTSDPDFPDPVAEAEQIAEVTGAAVVLAERSGHYPQADNPALVARAVVDLVSSAASQ